MKQLLLPAVLSVVCFAAGLVGTTVAVPPPAPADEADSLAVTADSVAVPAPGPDFAALPDSVAGLHRRLDAAQRELETLREQVRASEAADATASERRAEAEALSGTLTKLEDDELRAILDRIDFGVFETLYRASSARNQARLLQALPPERAARFVQRLTVGQMAPEPSLPVAPASRG